jgi:Trk-type K+ transport system membrane component
MFLIVLGGIGFPVLKDFGTNILLKYSGKRMKFRVHSKLVLLSSGILLFVGALMFFAIEYNNILRGNSVGEKLISSLFHSVSARTAGFNTVNVPDLSLATIFIIIALMWIGASPGSAGGGIKTTAFSISLLNLYAIARGKPNVEIFKRKISSKDISKSFSTIIISMVYITVAVFLLTLTESFRFEEILFEVISAASTVGLSEGITPYLSNAGKTVIVITMFIGRIGFLTFTFALFRSREIHNYDYVEEKIII